MRLIHNILKLLGVLLISYFIYIEYYLIALLLVLFLIVFPFIVKSKKAKKITREYKKKILSFKGVFISAFAFLVVFAVFYFFWDYKILIVLVLVLGFIIARIVYGFQNTKFNAEVSSINFKSKKSSTRKNGNSNWVNYSKKVK